MSYLKQLPLDTIKIDRTFVAGLESVADRSIVEAGIALAHGLRISVVAEGIEIEAQFDVLRAMGCDVGQGYLFAKPLPAPDVARLLLPSRSSTSPRAAGPQKTKTGRPPQGSRTRTGRARVRASAALKPRAAR